MKKILTVSIFCLLSLNLSAATAEKNTQPEPQPAITTAQPPEATAQGFTSEDKSFENIFSLKEQPEVPNTTKLLSKVMLFLFILGGSATCILYFFKRGRLSMMIPSRQRENGLVVRETKMLGNKQFLMVVEYENQKLLLGVGPGMINHLCYLNHGLNENEVPRETLTQRQEVL